MSTRSSATAAGQAGAAWAASSARGMPRMAPATGSITEHEPASMAREQRCALLCALVDADDREDADGSQAPVRHLGEVLARQVWLRRPAPAPRRQAGGRASEVV